MKLVDRINRLEAAQPGQHGIWHRVVVEVGQTEDEALDAYDRNRIAAGDHLIIRTIVGGLDSAE